MSVTVHQLAEILAGIVRSQQAIIDAVESANGGWKNSHLLPKVTTAANMRLAAPRLQDVAPRVLLRSQGRVPMDVAGIERLLHEAMAADAPAAGAPPSNESKPGAGGDDLSNFFDS
jgi:hypothetical protein